MNRLKEIYAYREMIMSLVRRDLRGRYKGSALGFLWTFINPILQLVVYTVVFSTIMRNGIKDYYLFLFVALVPWILFSTCLAGGASCIWVQQEMVKKIYFPRVVLPISYVTSQFINMILSFLIIFGVLIFSGRGLNFSSIMYLPIIMLIEYILCLGITLLFSAITVYLRDMEYILGIVSMAWQFMSPVLYGVESVPKNIVWIFKLNPMTSILTAYRDILYYAKNPELSTLISATLFGCLLLIIGFLVFNKLQKHFVEEL